MTPNITSKLSSNSNFPDNPPENKSIYFSSFWNPWRRLYGHLIKFYLENILKAVLKLTGILSVFELAWEGTMTGEADVQGLFDKTVLENGSHPNPSGHAGLSPYSDNIWKVKEKNVEQVIS